MMGDFKVGDINAMTPEQKVLDILAKHGPRTKEEILQFCGDIPAELPQYEQAIEKLADEGKLYRAHEDRWSGTGKPENPANNPVVFLTEEWYEKCKSNPAYAFYQGKTKRI
jgi:hypothetical protein